MGKVSTATTASKMKRKKKKGRLVNNSCLLYTSQGAVNFDSTVVTGRRSARFNNPKRLSSPTGKESNDDDDERMEKKVKLVGRLPEFDEGKEFNKRNLQERLHSRNQDLGSVSGSDSSKASGCRETHGEKCNISVVDGGSDGTVSKVKDVLKVTDAPKDGSRSPLESGPTMTPLPDKKWLVFILDRLQKKDTHGVFSEPVDLDELPDYLEVIEQPMDFGTIRRKLDSEEYDNLEQLEVDVFLICSNAMEYNSKNTVFYRQARAIQELAKRDFENLRHQGDDGEPQPMVVRRGRPPSNKNPIKTSPADRVVSSEPATLANVEEEKTIISSSGYNLRKAPPLNRFKSNDQFVSSYGFRNGENYSDWSADWNYEFPASILRADMRYGKKLFEIDETRRDTYNDSQPQFSTITSPLSLGDKQLLVPVGFHEPLAYARSLARFAANLGAVAWEMTSRRIESILPSGMQYGPGWVEETQPSDELNSNGCDVSSGPAQASTCKTTLQQRNGFVGSQTSYKNGFTSRNHLMQSDSNGVSEIQNTCLSNGGFSGAPDLNTKISVDPHQKHPDLGLQL